MRIRVKNAEYVLGLLDEKSSTETKKIIYADVNLYRQYSTTQNFIGDFLSDAKQIDLTSITKRRIIERILLEYRKK